MGVDILYYRQSAIEKVSDIQYPGMSLLSLGFDFIKAGVVPIDRTNTIKSPVRVKSVFPIPEMRLMAKTFETVCNERAIFILNQSDRHLCDIYVMWSGGIDSTLALVSLLKNSREDQKKRLIIIMSEDSIRENPEFFSKHIRGKLRVQTRLIFPSVIGSKDILVSGEHNDQVFGSDLMQTIIIRYGNDIIHAPYSRDVFYSHFRDIIGDIPANRYLDLLERLMRAAPIPIRSNFEFAWWYNFALWWQAVYMRTFTHITPRNASLITSEYAREYYLPFYNTEDFQLWSLNNPDKRIRDTWKSYKWVCKDIIYEYTKDADYRDNKVKGGSLIKFLRVNDAFNFLDSDFRLYRELDPSEYYDPENDFK